MTSNWYDVTHITLIRYCSNRGIYTGEKNNINVVRIMRKIETKPNQLISHGSFNYLQANKKNANEVYEENEESTISYVNKTKAKKTKRNVESKWM